MPFCASWEFDVPALIWMFLVNVCPPSVLNAPQTCASVLGMPSVSPAPPVPRSSRASYQMTAIFLPKISLDPTTGNIAVIWYDARDDLGTGGAGDTDGIPNTDAQVWGAFSTDGGQTFTKNIQISAGTSNSHD